LARLLTVQQAGELRDELRQLNGQVRELLEEEPEGSHMLIIDRIFWT